MYINSLELIWKKSWLIFLSFKKTVKYYLFFKEPNLITNGFDLCFPEKLTEYLTLFIYLRTCRNFNEPQ